MFYLLHSKQLNINILKQKYYNKMVLKKVKQNLLLSMDMVVAKFLFFTNGKIQWCMTIYDIQEIKLLR